MLMEHRAWDPEIQEKAHKIDETDSPETIAVYDLLVDQEILSDEKIDAQIAEYVAKHRAEDGG